MCKQRLPSQNLLIHQCIPLHTRHDKNHEIINYSNINKINKISRACQMITGLNNYIITDHYRARS